MTEADERPAYLVVVSSATQMYSGVGRVLFDWIQFAAPCFRFSMLMDVGHAENLRIAAEFSRAAGIALHISGTARRPGTPDTGMAAAARVLGSAEWGFIELVSWASAATALDVLAARPESARLIFTPHTQPLHTLLDPRTQFLVGPAFDQVVKAADMVCCTSPREYAELAARFPRLDCFRDTPNGCDAARFHPDGSAREGVLSVFDAREHRKRPDLLWNAFSAALSVRPQLRLAVAGRDTERLPVPHGLRGRVTVLGYVAEDELLRLYRAASCLVLLSDFEAFGLPLAEALMCGTPVVATRGAQQRSLFAGLPGVELVDNHDAQAAGSAILRAGLGLDPSVIAAAAAGRFGLEASCARKLAALQGLPARRPSPAVQVAPPVQLAAVAGWPQSQPSRPTVARVGMDRMGRTMRVVHVTPGYFAEASLLGGGERYVENVCKAVRAAGAAGPGTQVECSVVSFGPAGARLRSIGGFWYDIVAGRPEEPGSIDGTALDRLLDGADVVHVHQCFSRAGLFAASHARLQGRRVLGTDHGGEMMAALHAHPRLMGVYDAAMAYSRFGEAAFLDFDVPLHRIPGPVDDAQFAIGRAHWRDRRLLVAVGRILPHKGLHHVIDALPPGLSLVIAGRPYDPEYRRSLADRARGKDVTFDEALDDAGLLRLMQRAGLCVHFSGHTGPGGAFYHKPELLGLAPLEALCTGLPVLTSAAGSLRELDGLPGCRVVETPADLRRALERWEAGTDEVPTEAAIRQGVVARYGLRQFGSAYLGLLRSLVQGGP